MLFEERCVGGSPRLRNNEKIFGRSMTIGDVELDWVLAPEPGLVEELGGLWLAVVRSGGAVGFSPSEPAEAIHRSASAVVSWAVERRADLLIARTPSKLVGSLLLSPGRGPADRHCGLISRVMVHPTEQRQGLGSRMLAVAVERARGLGIKIVMLSTREGTGLPEFYRRLGWTEVGRWLAGIELPPSGPCDEIWMQKDVDP